MIALNYRDSRPIYEQIKEGFRRLILSGALATGEKLPSVRELATELAINPNTIQRAYRELEAEGFIYSIAGKGSFAAALSEVDDSRRQELMQRFEETARELLHLSVPPERLTARIQTLAQEVTL